MALQIVAKAYPALDSTTHAILENFKPFEVSNRGGPREACALNKPCRTSPNPRPATGLASIQNVWIGLHNPRTTHLGELQGQLASLKAEADMIGLHNPI